jgi:hypothetical protein
LGKWNGKDFSLSIKSSSLTVSFGGKAGADVFSWDGVGRLWTGMENGISYRRGLNGRIVAKWLSDSPSIGVGWLRKLMPAPRKLTEKMPARSRRWLASEEGLALEERARLRLAGLFADISAGSVVLPEPPPEALLPFVHTILAFDRERSAADAQHYHQVYQPVGILPPDQYFSVVLQATEGCSFNTCTYCTFYRDRPFRVKSPAQFLEHARQVKTFIGGGMSLRRTLFLGDANALAAPMKRLVEIFSITQQEFDIPALGGVFAFLDGFSGERKTVADYRTLASLGLTRVYIGMESGNPALLKFLKKPGEPSDVLNAVESMKQAGVAVGVIVLLGAGGHTYARQHVTDTVQLLNAMPLDADDLIYFSELIEDEGMDYTRDAHAANLRPLTSAERIAQGEEIEQKLIFSLEGGTPHISRYDIREFVY